MRYQKRPAVDEIALIENVSTAYSPEFSSEVTYPSKKDSPWYEGRKSGQYARIQDSQGRPTFRGWRKAVIVAAIVAGIVLATNIAFALIAFFKFRARMGAGTLYWGPCGTVKKWNTALHLSINILGTALFGASSFTMQCLSSPTRGEVDAAHAKRKALDIGVPSYKNLFYVKGWKGLLWMLLCLTTLPLHLFWNSVITASAGANVFAVIVAQSNFLTGAAYDDPSSMPISCSGKTDYEKVAAAMLSDYQAGAYTQLSALECLQDYSTGYITNNRNLIVITQDVSAPAWTGACKYSRKPWNGSSILAMTSASDTGTAWLDNFYPGLANPKQLRQEATTKGTWTLGNYTVESCYSERIESKCELLYFPYILYSVIACNLVKFLCMCAAARYLWNLDEPILATIGDAVSSFLSHPDKTTKDLCLMDLKDLRKGVWNHNSREPRYNPKYQRKPRCRLYSASTAVRWWMSMIPCVLYLITGFVLLRLSLGDTSYSFSETMTLKFGAIDGGLVLGLNSERGTSLVTDVIVANSFQLALSTTYFLYNSLYTVQCSALEWASYIRGKRKGLRVTFPMGQQRSTYYLQLPYRYGIPLTSMLVLMHFLISQSIFLARLTCSDWEGKLLPVDVSDVGFSPRAILTSCCVGAVLILAQVFHACRPLDNRIPIHGNRSAVISAMCHSLEDVTEPQMSYAAGPGTMKSIATKPVTWGVTRKPFDYEALNSSGIYAKVTEAGHCSFTADMVELPQIGKEYR